MNTRELAQEFTSAMNAGDWDTVESYLADDFRFSGPVPEPVGAQEWIALNKRLQAAMPDMSFNLQVIDVDENEVRTEDQMTGTQTAPLDLTSIGIGVIPVTGKSVSLPKEEGVARVKDGKVISIHLNTPEHGGIKGILSQLGVTPPTA